MTDALDTQRALLRLGELLDLSDDAIFTWELEAGIQYWNRGAERLYGFSRSEALGRLPWEFLQTRLSGGVEHFLEALARDGDWEGELDHRTRDGRRIAVDSRMVRVVRDGRSTILETNRDVTGRRRAEEALRDSEARLVAASAIAAIGIFEHDHVTEVLHWSDRMREFNGVGPDEPVDLALVHARAHPADRARLFEAIDKAHTPGGDGRFELEYRVIRPDGTIRWLLARSRTTFGGEGAERRPLRTVGAAIDVTDRKLAEEARLRQSEELDLAIRGADMGTWSWNLVTGELAWSDRCKCLFGLPAGEEVTYERFLDTIHPDDRARIDDAVQRSLRTGEEYRVEARVADPDGRITWVASIGRTIADPSTGRPAHMSGVVLDITDRKQLEADRQSRMEELEHRVAQRTRELHDANQELEARLEELEAFSYSVSHDLRAPLRHIDAYATILAEHHAAGLDEAGVGYLSRVRAAARRMGQLIEDLLALARVSRAELHRQPVHLSYMACVIAESLARTQPDRRVVWQIHPGVHAVGDPGLLRVALENLLGNAWKYTSKRDIARIEFGVAERAGERTFFVRDNGAGFDPKYAHRLFRPFSRLHGEAEFTGTGIGLATVHRILQRHGGEVSAEGEVGRGATFWFRLPPAPYVGTSST